MGNIFEKNKTYLGDCLELMPQMESGIFDMILCDLPYGTTACKWDTIIPLDKLWKEYERLIKPNGSIVLTASQPFTSALIMSNIKNFKYTWIWDKITARGHLTAKIRPMQQNEEICVFGKGRITYNPIMTSKNPKNIRKHISEAKRTDIMGGETTNYKRNGSDTNYPKTIITLNALHTTKCKHPTQKPVELMEYLIKTYTNEGELILDNCAGSGTTGEACYNTGRNYIQIEKEQKYFDLILEREKSFNKKDLYDGTLFETQM
jgi:site-specific DNA-methyltransferase (adenine-specific)